MININKISCSCITILLFKMKYSVEIEINLAMARVIELFDDLENLKKWQPGLESYELISGESENQGLN